MVYVQVPALAQGQAGFPLSSALIKTGLVVLVLAIPVGIAFGLLSTRRLTRRLQRLAASTLEVAEGGFQRRIPVSGATSCRSSRRTSTGWPASCRRPWTPAGELAEAHARHQERSRIARELHDSISQELFSISVLAGGLRRALPAGSAVLTEAETMERTAADTMREMQCLLLALRPAALDEAGLAGALEGVCRAYRERLGADVRADLDPLVLGLPRWSTPCCGSPRRRWPTRPGTPAPTPVTGPAPAPATARSSWRWPTTGAASPWPPGPIPAAWACAPCGTGPPSRAAR